MTEKTKTSGSDVIVGFVVLVLGLLAVAYLVMQAVPAFNGPKQFGFDDYATGVYATYGVLRLVRMALR